MQTQCHQKVLKSLLFAIFVVIAALGWACAADGGDDDSAGAGIGAGDAGGDVDTDGGAADVNAADCPDADSCDCADFHDDPDECEDVGCFSWTMGEYDIDKIIGSDESCEDIENPTKDTHEFCLDWPDPGYDDVAGYYAQYDDDLDEWRVFVAQHPINSNHRDNLELEISCPPADYPDAREVCKECTMLYE